LKIQIAPLMSSYTSQPEWPSCLKATISSSALHRAQQDYKDFLKKYSGGECPGTTPLA